MISVRFLKKYRRFFFCFLLTIMAGCAAVIQATDSNSGDNPESEQNHICPLAGNWDGYFEYGTGGRGGSVRGKFSAKFRCKDAKTFEGEIAEPWSPGFPEKYDAFHSEVTEGRYDASQKSLSFLKIYDFDSHSVDYRGSLLTPGTISGRWSIGDFSGSWKAVKRRR